LLKEYVAREGDALVPLEHEERGVRLGAWLSRQWCEWQSNTRGGYLSANRKLRLEQAGVVFNGPAPPASGVVGPHTLNERKWDTDDYNTAAEHWRPRAFDTTKPAREGDHWQAYSAESDPVMKEWLERRRKKGLMPPAPKPKEPYIPLAIVPPVKGLNMALAKRLEEAKKELEKERKGQRTMVPR